jgi:toxin secretion/phage lysis holin
MISNFIKWLGVAAAVVVGWLGNVPQVVMILVLLMALDIIAGIAAANAQKKMTSESAWNGISKKVITLILVGVAYVLTTPYLGVNIGEAAAVFYASSELVSILQKADYIGIPIPPFLKDGFKIEPPPALQTKKKRA